MDIFKVFATDTKLEKEGTWITLSGAARYKLARAGNRAYSKMLSKEVENNAAALETKDENADNLSDEIMIRVLAATILLDFEALDYDGVSQTYSKETAEKFLALKDFRRKVIQDSDNIENFRFKAEVAQGNALPAS